MMVETSSSMTGPPPQSTDGDAKDLPPLTVLSTRRSIEVSTDTSLSTEMVGVNDEDRRRSWCPRKSLARPNGASCCSWPNNFHLPLPQRSNGLQPIEHNP
eukprot:scaffold337578_cov57-Attheya_sp.AAC.2